MKKNSKYLCFAIIFVFVLQLIVMASPTFAAEGNKNQSKMLVTKGDKIVYADDQFVEINLVGVNIFDYLKGSHNLERSAMEAFDNWHSNIIRLPITLGEWSDEKNRQEVQRVIQMASDRGKYVILDLHEFGAFNEARHNFWKDAALLYKNNPTVLFGILNEVHDISWEQWRNGGGTVKEGKKEYTPIGHQTVVETIRDLGAKNIILAGGLDWGYDLRGIVGEVENDPKIYALIDQGSNNNLAMAGNGIIYDTHIYPWKGLSPEWDKAIGTARKMYPILSGENGWDADTIKVIINKVFEPNTDMYYTNWNPEFFKFANDNSKYGTKMNWTAWCFHPSSSPRILEDRPGWGNYDYSYTPTEYWGVNVKDQLNNVLGENLLTGKTIINSSNSRLAKLAIDGDYDTMWKDDSSGAKFIEMALGDEYVINKWAVRNAAAKSSEKDEQFKNAVDYKIQSSLDGVTWDDVDSITENKAPVTERTVKDFNARFIRFEFSKSSQIDDVLKIYDLFVSGHKPSINVSDINVETQAIENSKSKKNATITLPLVNESVDKKNVTVVTAVFKNGKLDPRYKVKKIQKEINGSYSIVLNDVIPNDDKHSITLLVYDSIDNIKAYQMNTVKE